MRLILRALIGILWLAWCAIGALQVTPIVSPEGVVTLAGELHTIQCDGQDRCRLVIEPALADGHPIPGPVTLIADGDVQGQAHPGDVVATVAFVRAERLDQNPGVSAPWSPPRARWRAWQVPTAHIGVSSRLSPWALPSEPLDRLTSPARGLYRALLLGDRRELTLSMRQDFADTGTAHLLAISGLHLAVLGWGLYRCVLLLLSLMGSWAQTQRLPVYAGLLAIGGVWAYVLGIQPSAATQRAATCLTLILLGGILARGLSAGRAVIATAVVLLTVEPQLLLGPSFQLSFAAVGALVASRPALSAIEAWLSEPGRLQGPYWGWLGRWLLRATGASLVTTLATAPLTLAWFGQLSPWGVVINLFAVPFTSLCVVPVGFVWYLLAGVAPEVAGSIAWLPEWTATALLDVISGCAHWTGPSHAAAWPHIAGALGAVSMVALCRATRVSALLSGLILVLALCVSPSGFEGVRVTALDVGHGDALIVQGPEGRTALIDSGGGGGTRGDGYLASKTLLPALSRLGITELDALVVTHADLDHMGAAQALSERLDIRELWVAPCALTHPRVVALVRRISVRGGRLRVLQSEDTIRWGDLRFEVLWPSREQGCAAGRNESGLVIRMDFGDARALLAADVGHETEMSLMMRADDVRADLLKVGHHGSRGSSGQAFVDVVSPKMALVSGRFVGGSMPPHQEVLRRLCEAGIQLDVTGRDGAIEWTMSLGGEVSQRRLRPP